MREVRTDGRFHSRDDPGHGVFVLSSVQRGNRTKPQRQTEKVLFSGMPVTVEQHPPEAGKLEDCAVESLPGVRQGVFLPASVRVGTKVLQPCLCESGKECIGWNL